MYTKKEKGDIGLTQAIVTFTKSFFHVSLPISEHLKYDMIVEKGGISCRVQVRYTSVTEEDKVQIKLASSWSNKKGNHSIKREYGDYDILACYCPDTDKCYFLADQEFSSNTSVILRTREPKRSNKNIRMAVDYEDCDRAFEVWKKMFLKNKIKFDNCDSFETLTKEKIQKLKQTLTWNEIGFIYDVSGATVRNKAADFGLELAKMRHASVQKGKSKYYKEVKRLNLLGWSQRKIAKELGCSRGNVEYIIKN